MVERISARMLLGYRGFDAKVYVTESYARVFGVESSPRLVRTALDNYMETHSDQRFGVVVPFAFYGIDSRPIEGVHIFTLREDEDQDTFCQWTMEDGCPVTRDAGSEETDLILSAERIVILTAQNSGRYPRIWPEIPELELVEHRS